MSDRIEIIKRNNKRFAILFSDIKSIAGVMPKKGYSNKVLYKEADQYYAMEDYSEISIFKLLKLWKRKQGYNYPIGVGTGGKIVVCRKSGYNILKVLLPWLNTLEKSQFYEFSPLEPKEFFEQLYVAYEKWKRLNVGSSSS